MFGNILIANRGEIACRVIRTAQRLGYRTVAVYSEADAHAPHVAQADAAVCLGKPPASESYLRIDALLAAAKASGADAVHPGYGFLSERADFARACAGAGLVFIGPPPRSIEVMGNKALAKRCMLDAGVPCVPGYLAEAQDDERLMAEAAVLGFPLLVKAVAAGGGRGIRFVQHAPELPEALAGARREAQSAFGDGTLMLERLVRNARHIEIQVFADAQGNVVHLGERDCTAQRRRQKVLEEAPSPIVGQTMREAMGRDAVTAARAVGYLGAGTVEFIVDDSLRHYFLEMNTRLQVEHPVTECVTGLDLVEWQLRVAAGEPLPLQQDQIRFAGHAIEARLYAEDPGNGFRPQSGRIAWWRPDIALRPGVRIDAGVAEGGQITPYYDALAAKLIVHGRDRADAIRRLGAVIEDAPLLGLPTNGRFLRDLIRHPAFVQARMHTTLIDTWAEAGEPLLRAPRPALQDWLVAAGLLLLQGEVAGAAPRPAGVATYELLLQCGQEQKRLRVSVHGGRADLLVDGQTHQFCLLGTAADGRHRLALDGVQRSVAAVRVGAGAGASSGGQVHLASDAATFVFEEPSPYPLASDALDPRHARAPVAGVVVQLRVNPGDTVLEGEQLLCVEAMKMEMWLVAGAGGRVKAVHARIGDAVAANAVLVEVEVNT
ncbi:Acetyl-/propionyl-coenzyme A carboxylase alpha chain (Includes: Biotin carboxylase; Biotin carboxyl carrier protein) [Burkholderiales bacterium]|nr:Acetyl-/propionyl-coenzyme A carboxylase alpha chain (Includes: Biotin carboxylase; Biotin carboxyl carrier protein) [Burkholderiales bacterium]